MVMPRSRSALSLSSTQAYLKEPLPSSAASCASMGVSQGRGGSLRSRGAVVLMMEGRGGGPCATVG